MTVRRRATTDGWRARMPCPAFDASGIPERTLATARAGWLRLCADERESVTAVALIIRDLAMLGAPPPVLGSFARVLEDEIRHVEVCATVVRALGGTVAEQAPQALDELGPGDRRWRTARALVAGFVAGESLSAAALTAGWREATVPIVRWAYGELMRDEARHAGVGARAAAWVLEPYDQQARRALWPACVEVMETFEYRAGGDDRDDAAAVDLLASCRALGMLARSTVQSAIIETIPRRVLPKLIALQVCPMPTS